MSQKLPNPGSSAPDQSGPILTLPICILLGCGAGLLLHFLIDGASLAYCLLLGVGVGAVVGLLFSHLGK